MRTIKTIVFLIICTLCSHAVVLREFPLLAQLQLRELMLPGSVSQKADDDIAELKKVSEKLSRKRYAATMSYQLYESYTSLRPIETQKMEVKTWDLMMNIKSDQFHVIRNKEHYVYVDLQHQFIMLNKVYSYKKELDRAKELESMMSIDTLIKMHSKITVIQTGKDTKTYRIFFKDGVQYAYTDVMINTAQLTLVKMTMYYTKKLKDILGKQDKYPAEQLPRMEVVFTNFVSFSKLDPANFSISGYLVKKGKQFALTGPYTKYKFINNTNN